MKYVNNEKLNRIKLTKSNFYVAIDFDKTITATESADSWDASGKILGDEFKEKLYNLYFKYGPIEQDYNISFEEKYKAMEEWYYSCMQLYYDYGLTQEKLKESIDSSNIVFRKGAKNFLNELYKNNVPVIILSAGIGNVIERFLQKNECLYKNMEIISNFISFDSNGKIKKYTGELIHTLNKTMDGKVTYDFFEKIKKKKYGLLFGDFVEDKKMIPMNEWNNTVSVGFLGKNVEQNLEVYKDNFDIVLTQDDASFDTAIGMIFKD